MCVVVVDHMEVAVSAPWHSLYQPFSEMVESDGHLHCPVSCIRIAVPQKYHLVVMGEVVVRYSNGGGGNNGVN